MKKLCVLIFVMVFPVMLFAQQTRYVSGDYTYRGSWSVTPNEARDKAIEGARIQALADAFGTLVDIHTTSLFQSENGRSNSNFISLGETSVKGEWLGDTKKPVVSVQIEGDYIVANATVWGQAREILSAPIDINALLLKQTNGKHDEDQFHHGDNIYISFKSPSKGYLAVYLVDGKGEPYCLLPYADDEDGQFPVKANKNYLLFSEQHADNGEKCEEYLMTCEREVSEQNLVYIIFSPNKFTKANDDESSKVMNVNGKSEFVPRFLAYADFQKWLMRCRRADKDMQVVIRPVTVSK